MQIQVNDLYEQSKNKYKLQFHAGQNGLNNSISWIYLAEDIQNISFLKGGELIITTGLFINSNVTLKDFICELSLKNCCCVIINIGKYLTEECITDEIKEFCNFNKIPLFTMPWEIHLVEIMQDFSRLLLQSSQKEDTLSAAFQNALYQTTVPEHILRTLNQFGFTNSADYRILVIRNLHDSTIITSPLNSYGLKYHLFSYDNLQILIYSCTQVQLTLDKILEIICYCDGIIIGVSDIIHGLLLIAESYKRACFSLAVAEFWNRPYTIFDDLGIFQLLFCNYSPDLLQSNYEHTLGKIEKYDMDHDTVYLETLRIYLLSDCNLLETAARMFTHRNTVVYRIRKIKNLLENELDSFSFKFDLMLAFYIRDYMSI
jgi:hypothetical protein